MLSSGKDIIWAFLFLLKVGQFVLAEWDLDMEYGLDYEEKEIIEALDNNTEICAVGHSSDPKCQAYRLAKKTGEVSEDFFTGLLDKNYKANLNKKASGGGGGLFRSAKEKRGSKVALQKKVPPWDHKPQEGEIQGCGNPICVVIDRKVRRFKSVCKYSKFVCDESRKNQMNFIQKGDCYDIIDGDGAEKEPWTPPDLDLGDCEACKKDEYCGKKVTVNIDLKNIVMGESSAYGSSDFNEQNAQSGRMVGVPIEFSNICQLMKFMKSRENLNIKTQVIGIALGAKKEIFPLDKDSRSCLWTEWFDHDTPCNSDGDLEKHSDHIQRLEETHTGSLRICMPVEYGGLPQYEGGSEVFQVSAQDAKEGTAVGYSGEKFQQVVEWDQMQIQCEDTKQTIKKLPAPFIFAEGVKDDPKKNAACLDYKMRYCCKGNAMYRPTSIDYFSGFIPPEVPIGPAKAKIAISSEGGEPSFKQAIITVFPQHASAEESDAAKIIVKAKGGGGGKKSNPASVVIEHGKTTTLDDSSYVAKKTPNGVMEIIITISIKGQAFAKIVLATDSSGTKVSKISINAKGNLKSESVIEEGSSGGSGNKQGEDNGSGDCTITTTVTNKGRAGSVLTITSSCNGEIIQSKGDLKIETKSGVDVWKGLSELNAEVNVEYFIESPPLATIFAECKWMDWISSDYPNKVNTGAEWEFRTQLMKNKKYFKHVCGKVMENAHYVDAVTREDLVPWHELKADKKNYEVFKLTPFHGYVCNDQNIPDKKNYCQDMKIRFCCAKRERAQWSKWGQWSQCSVSCGGGEQKRTKTCKQSKMRKKGSALHAISYISTCVGEENEAKRKQLSEQIRTCNVQGCPVDYKWGSWCMWSSCSVSCSQGTKTRSRVCYPAKDGGAECPDKRKEKNLYYEDKPCTPGDCITYHPGLWTAWSSCSASCGQGVRSKTRECFNTLTLKQTERKNCANEEKYFKQTQACKSRECPVDGGWSNWENWSVCDQACIDHPDNGEETKARRIRRRYCINPPRAYGGKPCEKNPKYKWLSHEKAEAEETVCITEKNKKPGDKVVPWCPENCILTEWGEWGQCSETCVVNMLGETIKFGGYEENGEPEKRKASSIVMYKPNPQKTMPKRTRRRDVAKPARFGGTCPSGNFWSGKKEVNNSTIIFQDQDCTLCLEHCRSIDGKINQENLVDWPQLKYPHPKNPGCVGYCPIDCKWKEPVVKADCKKAQEEYFASKNSSKKKYGTDHCFKSELLFKLAEYKLIDEVNGLQTEMEAAIEKLKKTNEPESLPELWSQFKSIGKLKGDDAYRDQTSSFSLMWSTDRNKILELMKHEVSKKAEVPVLDGLYGGKPCIRESDKKQLTVRKNEDKKYDEKKMHNNIPEEYDVTYDQCELILCSPPIREETEPFEPGDVECIQFQWSAWGEWGKCDLKCGGEGKRKKKRKCMNTCTQEPADNGKCKPFENKIQNKTFTDTDQTVCTPCPQTEVSSWSEWGDFEWPEAKCGEAVKKTRKRTCVPGKSGEKKCEGDDSETVEVPGPECPTNYGKKPDKGETGTEDSQDTYNGAGDEKAGTEDEEAAGYEAGQDYMDSESLYSDDDSSDSESYSSGSYSSGSSQDYLFNADDNSDDYN